MLRLEEIWEYRGGENRGIRRGEGVRGLEWRKERNLEFGGGVTLREREERAL